MRKTAKPTIANSISTDELKAILDQVEADGVNENLIIKLEVKGRVIDFVQWDRFDNAPRTMRLTKILRREAKSKPKTLTAWKVQELMDDGTWDTDEDLIYTEHNQPED